MKKKTSLRRLARYEYAIDCCVYIHAQHWSARSDLDGVHATVWCIHEKIYKLPLRLVLQPYNTYSIYSFYRQLQLYEQKSTISTSFEAAKATNVAT